uniref:Uncharacterized protein n=1 Tax=Setaria viridis TaxID=4556 RepID=A0A4U6U9N9_SETVI|nr:hypothetical protein SEVIR_6G175500v2 [Setaria viridis]
MDVLTQVTIVWELYASTHTRHALLLHLLRARGKYRLMLGNYPWRSCRPACSARTTAVRHHLAPPTSQLPRETLHPSPEAVRARVLLDVLLPSPISSPSNFLTLLQFPHRIFLL